MRSQAKQRPQQHRSAPETVGERAAQRRTEELHDAVAHDQRTVAIRLELAARRVLADEHRQDRQRDADAEDVDEYNDQDERQAARRRPRPASVNLPSPEVH
jgi:hypothetical protein